MLHVQNHAAFVAVQRQKGRRLAIDKWRPVAPSIVAAVGLLHLDDVGTHVRQHHGAEGPCQYLAEVHDGDTVQGQCVSHIVLRLRVY